MEKRTVQLFTPVSSSWRLRLGHNAGAAGLKLFCFPYAGGGPAIFRQWPDQLPESVEVWAIQLPGRGNRIKEDPRSELEPLVADVANAVLPLLDCRFALFGHSFGAILAFETARYLRRRTGLSPAHLFVSGRRAPHLPDTDPPGHDLGDEEFIDYLRELNGTPAAVFDDRELLDLLLPALRADFRLAETYQLSPGMPLQCPITAFGGADDEESEDDRLDGWSQHTNGPFVKYMLAGDHFFIHSQERELLQRLRTDLNRPDRQTTFSEPVIPRRDGTN